MLFAIGLDTLQVKKVVLHVLFLIIMQVHSYDSLPLEKRLTLHNFIIVIKPVFHKNENNYCYNIFLEKCFCEIVGIS